MVGKRARAATCVLVVGVGATVSIAGCQPRNWSEGSPIASTSGAESPLTNTAVPNAAAESERPAPAASAPNANATPNANAMPASPQPTALNHSPVARATLAEPTPVAAPATPATPATPASAPATPSAEAELTAMQRTFAARELAYGHAQQDQAMAQAELKRTTQLERDARREFQAAKAQLHQAEIRLAKELRQMDEQQRKATAAKTKAPVTQPRDAKLAQPKDAKPAESTSERPQPQ